MGELRPDTILLNWLLMLPFFAALGAGLFPRLRLQPHSEQEARAMPLGPFIIASLASFLGGGLAVSLLPQVASGPPITADYWWTRDLYHLRWSADVFTLASVALIHGVSLVSYLCLAGLPLPGPHYRRVAFLLLAQGTAAAACLSADVILMVCCLQGAIIFLWLAQRQEDREEANPLLAAAFAGSLLLMAAVVLLWNRTGDTSTAPLPFLLVALEPAELRGLAMLLLLGALPLFAAWPVNGWLVSLASEGAGRALASALLLPVLGMTLALRLLPGMLMLTALPGLGSIALFLGLVGLWWGAVRAALTHSLRQFAAWLTVTQGGLFLVTLGALAHPLAPPGLAQIAALQMFAAILALAAIWLAVETIGGRWGTDSIPDLAGVVAHAPLAAGALILGGLSLVAAPFLAGFQVQRLLLPALLQEHRIWIALLLVLADLMLAFAVLDTLRKIFAPARTPLMPTWTSGWLTLGLLVAIGALLWAAFFPTSLHRWAGNAAQRALSITQSSYSLTP